MMLIQMNVFVCHLTAYCVHVVDQAGQCDSNDLMEDMLDEPELLMTN